MLDFDLQEQLENVLDSLFVNDHGHATLAVLAFTTEEPHGLRIVDHDGVDGDHAHVGARFNWLVARVHALNTRVHVGDGNTGVVEVGLRDGMVSGPELELDHAAGFGSDFVGPELDARLVGSGVQAYGNDLDVDSWNNCQSNSLRDVQQPYVP